MVCGELMREPWWPVTPTIQEATRKTIRSYDVVESRGRRASLSQIRSRATMRVRTVSRMRKNIVKRYGLIVSRYTGIHSQVQ